MFKSTTRIASIAPLSRALPRTRAARRFISTAPPHQKSRSWKSSAARWGLAGALVYYYNTATAFAEEPQCKFDRKMICAELCTNRNRCCASSSRNCARDRDLSNRSINNRGEESAGEITSGAAFKQYAIRDSQHSCRWRGSGSRLTRGARRGSERARRI